MTDLRAQAFVILERWEVAQIVLGGTNPTVDFLRDVLERHHLGILNGCAVCHRDYPCPDEQGVYRALGLVE